MADIDIELAGMEILYAGIGDPKYCPATLLKIWFAWVGWITKPEKAYIFIMQTAPTHQIRRFDWEKCYEI